MTPRQLMDGEYVWSPLISKLINLSGSETSQSRIIGGNSNECKNYCVSIRNQDYSSDTSIGYNNAYAPKIYNFYA